MENTIELLKKLTQTVGVSGEEKNIVTLLKEILSPYGDVTVDSLNNIFCTFGEGYHFLLDAHLDEIGMIVTEITDDGFIKVSNCGGIDTRPLPATEVSVWGKKELKGVISTLPPHLQNSDDEKKVTKLYDLSIDVGLTKDKTEKIVSLGDKVTFKRNFTPLLNSRISASCLDDRSGVASILLCLDELKKLPCKTTIMFSSQEEVGTRGAKTGVFDKCVDEAIVVDVSFAYSYGCDKSECGELNKGPMIGFSPILNKDMSAKLVDISSKNNIPYQQEIMNGTTGTNADVITVSQSGVKTALISIPERYMHQRTEVVDLNDVENTAKLICAYISERSNEVNA